MTAAGWLRRAGRGEGAPACNIWAAGAGVEACDGAPPRLQRLGRGRGCRGLTDGCGRGRIADAGRGDGISGGRLGWDGRGLAGGSGRRDAAGHGGIRGGGTDRRLGGGCGTTRGAASVCGTTCVSIGGLRCGRGTSPAAPRCAGRCAGCHRGGQRVTHGAPGGHVEAGSPVAQRTPAHGADDQVGNLDKERHDEHDGKGDHEGPHERQQRVGKRLGVAKRAEDPRERRPGYRHGKQQAYQTDDQPDEGTDEQIEAKGPKEQLDEPPEVAARHPEARAPLPRCAEAVVDRQAHQTHVIDDHEQDGACCAYGNQHAQNHVVPQAGLPVAPQYPGQHERGEENGQDGTVEYRGHPGLGATRPEVAIAAREHVSRHGRLHTPRSLAQPAQEVAKRDDLPHDRHQLEQGEQTQLAKHVARRAERRPRPSEEPSVRHDKRPFSRMTPPAPLRYDPP